MPKRTQQLRAVCRLTGRKVTVEIAPTVDRTCRLSEINFDYIEINGTGTFRKRK